MASGSPHAGQSPWTSEPGKTSLLRQHEVLDRQRNRRDGRRLRRLIETRDHPARHVDRQRQPRPLQRLAERPIDDDDVDQRVIDLDDLISVLGKVFSGDRAKAIPRGFGAVRALVSSAGFIASMRARSVCHSAP